MPTTVTLKNLGAFAGATNLQLFLRKTSDNTLLAAGGDTGVDADSIGSFAWTIGEEIPSEQLLARIYEGAAETAANIVIDSVLNVGFTEIGQEAAVLNTTGQDAIAAKVATVLAGSHGAGSWEGGGGAGGGGLTEGQAAQLTEIHEAMYPEDPDVSPIVITPAAIGETTGYFVCRDAANAPKSGVVVSVILDKLRSGSAGTAFFATAREFTSAENGLVQITHLIPGCAYNLTISGALHWVRIPPSAGTTFALPDIKN